MGLGYGLGIGFRVRHHCRGRRHPDMPATFIAAPAACREGQKQKKPSRPTSKPQRPMYAFLCVDAGSKLPAPRQGCRAPTAAFLAAGNPDRLQPPGHGTSCHVCRPWIGQVRYLPDFAERCLLVQARFWRRGSQRHFDGHGAGYGGVPGMLKFAAPGSRVDPHCRDAIA